MFNSLQSQQEILDNVAKKLHGRQYRDETTKEIEEYCKLNNIVILFGASDDLAEFRGAVTDEVYCFDGGYIVDDPFIVAVWLPGESNSNQSWCYKLPSNLLNARFDIFEDETIYCTGVVFFKPELFKLKN
jgi:hypothetical protein